MHIGIIGTGNMGTILTSALIDSKAVPGEKIYITNRTIEKAYRIKEVYKDIRVENSVKELVRKSDMIFICTKPLDIHPLLMKIKPYLTEDKCLISITSPISAEQLESAVSCSCVRVIPSITNRALSGICLVTFGEKCSEYWRKQVLQLVSCISRPVEIDQDITRVVSDIVSCGPAFFSYILRKFIDAAVKETGIDEELATKLTAEMLVGMGALIGKNYYDFPTLQEKVCVKGGITGEGIQVLEQYPIEKTFRELFKATHKKYRKDIKNIKQQFEYHNV